MPVIRQIIGSFGDIGQEVVKEAAKVPGDIAGKALESMGTQGGKKQGNQQKTKTAKTSGEKTLEGVTKTNDEATKKAIARKALEELVGIGKPRKEPTVWEKKQTEEEEKKKALIERKKKEDQEILRPVSTKPRKGNLYGLGVKTDIEKQRNAKAE